MEGEILRIYDDHMNSTGQKSREDIHKHGDWHETFHCWVTVKDNKEYHVLLQKRAAIKKDYPNLLDITSAGHLLAEEQIKDGVREVEEELGISVEFKDLIPLGISKEEIKLEQIWDREICHVFLYECEEMPEFNLQVDEVDSLYTLKLKDGIRLFNGSEAEIEINEVGHPDNSLTVTSSDFVGHGSYFLKAFQWIEEKQK